MCDAVDSLRYCPDCRRAVADHASGDAVWRTNGCSHAGNLAATNVPDPASAVGKAVCSGARGEGASCLASPRMRGAVLALPHHFLGASTIPDGADGTCLVLPRMRGAVRVAAPPTPKMSDVFHTIDDMAVRLGIAAAVSNHAKEVFRKLEHDKVFPRGGKCRNRHALYAACLHVACRVQGTPCTFKELASLTGNSATAGIKDIGRLVKHIKVHFGEEEGGQAEGEMVRMVRTDGCSHAATNVPDPASVGKVVCSEARAEGTFCLASPRTRGPVLALPHHFLGAATIPCPASDGAEGTCLVLPRMRGTVRVTAPSRGVAPATTKMRGVVLDADAFHTIEDMAARLGIAAAVSDHAKEVFRKLEHDKVFPRGGKCRNRHALYAACLHVACRAQGTPCTFKELASLTGDSATAGVKDIGRLVKHIKVHFGEEEGGQAEGEMVIRMGRAGDYVRRFGSLVGIGDQEVDVAFEAARRLEKNLDVRRSPDSIAAAVIYMVVQRSRVGKSIGDVSTATGVSELTIKEVYYRDLSPHAKLLFD